MNDEPALTLEAIFERYAAFVWRTLRYLGVPDSDLEDVLQETFLVVHRRLPGFERRSTVRTWLYGVCLRVASDHRRRRLLRPEDATGRLPDTGVPAHQLEDLEKSRARARLRAILDTLDEDRRAVFVLHDIEGLPMQEVAAAVRCPVQTGYWRLHAARKQVLAAFEREADGRQRP